ncbi:MAG: haloacid dehalogenase-like hydrolase [Acidobacteria bacterium]|nr:haloacid dehalogenase-like hydrolase [Acidobacteriota bacterium]
MQRTIQTIKRYLVASDFDQTLSFHDSGYVLSELVGIPAMEFERKAAILAVQNLVQQGGELAYLLLHDPDLKGRVRKDLLRQAGKEIRLKRNIRQLGELLAGAIDGYSFDFHVISAAPQEVVESALEGIIAPDHIHGTQLLYDDSGHIAEIIRVTAGYGKVATVDDLQAALQIGADRVIYVGDGSSDVHVMLHVNQREGFTIAVSESRKIAQIAKRTVLSDDALSVLVPILEGIVGWDRQRIRNFFESQGLLIQGWDKVQTEWLTFRSNGQSDQMPEALNDNLPARDGL